MESYVGIAAEQGCSQQALLASPRLSPECPPNGSCLGRTLKHTGRSVARRWRALDQEVHNLDELIEPLVCKQLPPC